MKSFYITFGQAHAHSIAGKTIDKDCVVKIFRDDEEDARGWAFRVFGQKWSFLKKEKPDMEYYPRGIITL